MDTPHEVTGPMNLGNPSEFTIRELATKILAMVGSKSELQFRPLPEDDPVQRRPTIDRAARELGWIPEIDLDEGLARTVAYFRSSLPGHLAEPASVALPA